MVVVRLRATQLHWIVIAFKYADLVIVFFRPKISHLLLAIIYTYSLLNPFACTNIIGHFVKNLCLKRMFFLLLLLNLVKPSYDSRGGNFVRTTWVDWQWFSGVADWLLHMYDLLVGSMHNDALYTLMNGPIRKKLGIIPSSVTWGGVYCEVFSLSFFI